MNRRHLTCCLYQEAGSLADAGNPYRNLAVEEFLVQYVAGHIPEDRAVLYFWRNADCVVFGRNQNPSEECRLDLMEELGVLPVRRKTGGGAVFHDLQNLNFSFIVPGSAYDRESSMQIVVRALQSCGIDARANGRNDIVAGECKVSGNAYLSKGEVCLHHGTLLIDTDIGKMERLLTVGTGKLTGKGIRSVRSRVRNLKEIMPACTAEAYGKALADSFLECYAGDKDAALVPLTMGERGLESIHKLQEAYASGEWIFGHEETPVWQRSRRFGWGNCTVQCTGSSYRVYSDTLYAEAFAQVRKIVHGQVSGSGCAGTARETLTAQQETMLQDICGLIGTYGKNRVEAG